MSPCEIGGVLDFGDTNILLKCLAHLPIFHVDEGCNILWLTPINPRRVPKSGLRAVSNSDEGGGIEKLSPLHHKNLCQPKAWLVLSFVPMPSYELYNRSGSFSKKNNEEK